MSLVKTFNDHFMEFIDDVLVVFPSNMEIILARTTLLGIKKINPSLLIRYWYDYVNVPYKENIDNGDIDFFIEKDYSQDVKDFEDPGYFLKAIDRFRGPIRDMQQENKEKSFEYIKNLCALSDMYHKEKMSKKR